MLALVNFLERTFCRHRHVIRADGRVLYVACIKCGAGSHGIITG